MKAEFDILSLALLSCECKAGTGATICSWLPKGLHRISGDQFFYRFFWRQRGSKAWEELSLKVEWTSICNILSGNWPPEQMLKLECDDDGLTAGYVDDIEKAGVLWIREARFDFARKKWALRKVRQWNDNFDSLAGGQGALSSSSQEELNRTFGNGLPKFGIPFYIPFD